MTQLLSTNGLTSTSANTVANWAKESVSTDLTIKFVNEYIALISTPNNYILSKQGVSSLDHIDNLLEKKAQAYTLIAWIREALKAKEEQIKAVKATTLRQFCDQQNLEFPTDPEKPHELTEEEYYASLTPSELLQYYKLEAECAVLGKYIHPNGSFAIARAQLSEAVATPIKADNDGSNTIIRKYCPSLDPKEVEDKFKE